VDALTGSGTVDNTCTSGTGNSTLTVGNNNGSGTFSGVLQNNNAVSRSLYLTKVGTGTQTLNGASTYSGYTTISGGTLALGSSGSIDNSPRIIIAAGATFDVSAISSYTAGSGITNLLASGTGTDVGTTAAAIKGGTSVDLGSVARISLTNDSSNPSLYISQGTLSLNNNAFYIYSDGSYSVLPDGDYAIIQQASGGINGTVASSTVGGNAVSGKDASVSIVEGTVVLHVSTPIEITAPGIVGGNFQLSFSGPNGQTWSVLTNADVSQPLASWGVLSSGTFTTEPVTVIDPNGTALPSLFYRVISPSP
jgi:autotransporter-associated beta strand protein